MGDPFSRYVQLLLTVTPRPRPGGRRRRHGHDGVRRPTRPRRTPGALAPARAAGRARATCSSRRCPRRPAAGSPRAGAGTVEVFTSMPMERRPPGVDRHRQRLRLDPRHASARPASPRAPTWWAPRWWRPASWTASATSRRSRPLARAHGVTRYFAHRRETADKLPPLHARDRPGDRPPRPAAGTHRPPRPDRPHDPELPLHRRPHPAPRPRGHRGPRRGLRHRPGVAHGQRLTARPGLPGRGDGHGARSPWSGDGGRLAGARRASRVSYSGARPVIPWGERPFQRIGQKDELLYPLVTIDMRPVTELSFPYAAELLLIAPELALDEAYPQRVNKEAYPQWVNQLMSRESEADLPGKSRCPAS